jgi:signal transduction histidine kinase
MTPQANPLEISRADLKPKYERVLRHYLRDGTEVDLVKAYELGRNAFAQDVGILEIVSLHQRALAGLSPQGQHRDEIQRAAKLAGQFLIEVFSAYELGRRSYHETVSSLRHLNALLEQEIKRIAHVVHDEAGQLLVAAHLAIAEVVREATPSMRAPLRRVSQLLNQAEKHLRHFSHELRPTVLDDLGLTPAIRFLANRISQRAALPIRVISSINCRLPSEVEMGLYRIVQEALINVTRHSRARNVKIELRIKGEKILCIVQDDGVGFDPQASRSKNGNKGLGLVGIQERLNVLKGTLRIESESGRGTKLRISLPMGG